MKSQEAIKHYRYGITHDIYKEPVTTYAKLSIQALEEVEQYRALGTVEELKEAREFKKYFDELYGEGLEVANWHKNGDLEPFDNFYESALDRSEEDD